MPQGRRRPQRIYRIVDNHSGWHGVEVHTDDRDKLLQAIEDFTQGRRWFFVVAYGTIGSGGTWSGQRAGKGYSTVLPVTRADQFTSHREKMLHQGINDFDEIDRFIIRYK